MSPGGDPAAKQREKRVEQIVFPRIYGHRLRGVRASLPVGISNASAAHVLIKSEGSFPDRHRRFDDLSA